MARNRAQQLCIVTLDYQRFLLPQADALKLIDIMSRAAEVQADYASGAGFKYTVGEAPEVELTVVRPSQLVMPQAKPAQLHHAFAGSLRPSSRTIPFGCWRVLIMTKTFAMCRIDGLIELREEHPGEGYFALAVGDLASVRAAVFATAEPHQVGKKVARRVPGVSPDATDRENLGSIARYIQTLGQQDRPGFRALGV
ncbi:hypothetical protein AAAB92_27190 [Pseudomonas aeruginosa]|uniref:hypothetical protein n=1 Tax=Pseudomonas aeruginosa TaxID=287 RepID=UPI0030F3030A